MGHTRFSHYLFSKKKKILPLPPSPIFPSSSIQRTLRRRTTKTTTTTTRRESSRNAFLKMTDNLNSVDALLCSILLPKFLSKKKKKKKKKKKNSPLKKKKKKKKKK